MFRKIIGMSDADFERALEETDEKIRREKSQSRKQKTRKRKKGKNPFDPNKARSFTGFKFKRINGGI